ncbi:MAG TPA: hypothetical protein VM791_12065 [Vicinamibacterales bacterium]|nr:hypothetical protein [Vicinamibacterales bacterium]
MPGEGNPSSGRFVSIAPFVTGRSWKTKPSPFDENTNGTFSVRAYSRACWIPSPTLQ